MQVLRLAETAGLVKLGHVALDGTKIKANASKHKAMSYERMKRREAELSAEVDRWLAAAAAADAEEDKRLGDKPAVAIFNQEIPKLACTERTSALRCFILGREWLVGERTGLAVIL